MNNKTTNNYTLRIPLDLRKKLEVIAKEDDRTLSNLILKILNDYIKDKK